VPVLLRLLQTRKPLTQPGGLAPGPEARAATRVEKAVVAVGVSNGPGVLALLKLVKDRGCVRRLGHFRPSREV